MVETSKGVWAYEVAKPAASVSTEVAALTARGAKDKKDAATAEAIAKALSDHQPAEVVLPLTFGDIFVQSPAVRWCLLHNCEVESLAVMRQLCSTFMRDVPRVINSKDWQLKHRFVILYKEFSRKQCTTYYRRNPQEAGWLAIITGSDMARPDLLMRQLASGMASSRVFSFIWTNFEDSQDSSRADYDPELQLALALSLSMLEQEQLQLQLQQLLQQRHRRLFNIWTPVQISDSSRLDSSYEATATLVAAESAAAGPVAKLTLPVLDLKLSELKGRDPDDAPMATPRKVAPDSLRRKSLGRSSERSPSLLPPMQPNIDQRTNLRGGRSSETPETPSSAGVATPYLSHICRRCWSDWSAWSAWSNWSNWSNWSSWSC
jgi:hypothetical protein